MTPRFVLFEDPGWRDLRPLTDLLPVPALAFGASDLARRWIAAAGMPFAGLVARPGLVEAWRDAPEPAVEAAGEGDLVAIDAAVLPGAWASRLAEPGPAAYQAGGRLVAVRASARALEPHLRRGDFAQALAGLPLPRVDVDARVLGHPWDVIAWNTEAIAEDLARAGGIAGEVHPSAVLLAPERIEIAKGARIDPLAVLDARTGPIRIGPDARVAPNTLVVGPCAVGRGTQLLGGMIGHSTLGPECRIAGEVDDCVWQGYANKRHHGFVGHSVVGEWVNLGALTTTSDLKNNYGSVRVWVDGREIDSGASKVGTFFGAHVKTGIGTLLPTGASIGVGSNLFGGGRFAPKHLPPFSWWDGERLVEHQLELFLATARTAMGRRDLALAPAEQELMRQLAAATRAEREAWPTGTRAGRTPVTG